MSDSLRPYGLWPARFLCPWNSPGKNTGKWKESESEVAQLCVQLFLTPWIVAHQAPPSMRFSRQEYWSGLPCPSPGDLPNPGIKPRSLALQADTLPSEPPEKPKPMGCSKSNSKRRVYSNTILPQETRKSLGNLTLYLKQLEKEEEQKKISRRKEIIKIWPERNEKEMKETIVKINKIKS